MKKLLLVLGMITCLLGVSACGNATTEDTAAFNAITQDQAVQYVTNTVTSINQIVLAGQEEQYSSDEAVAAAFSSWKIALDEMGDYQSIDKVSLEQDADGAIMTAQLTGTKRNAALEIVLDKDLVLTSFSVNPIYSFGEQMEKAGLNTLMGMGTVFIVLILISLLISLFAYIPKIQNAFKKKPVATTEESKVVAQIVENEANVAENNDLELVAVISAAIAANEGAASSDGYVVRSIRRIR